MPTISKLMKSEPLPDYQLEMSKAVTTCKDGHKTARITVSISFAQAEFLRSYAKKLAVRDMERMNYSKVVRELISAAMKETPK
jgi:hypothetical protein